MVAVAACTGHPERKQVAWPERLADDRHGRPGHVIEHRPFVRGRQLVEAGDLDGHGRPAVRPHGQREVVARRRPGVLGGAVGDLDPPAVHAPDGPVAHRIRLARQQRYEGSTVGAVPDGHPVEVGDGGEKVHVGGQGVAGTTACPPRPRHQQRRVPDGLELRHVGLAPHIPAVPLVTQVVAVVGADHEGRVVPEAALVEGVEDASEPVVDHRELRAVVGTDVATLAFGQVAATDGPVGIRRPDDPLLVPRLILVASDPRGRGVERLVGVELVDEQEPAVVVRGGVAQEPGGLGHGARTRVVGLFAEERSGTVVGLLAGFEAGHAAPPPATLAGGHRWCAHPRRVGVGPPGVAFMAADVVPATEVGVVVLAARLEKVGMVCDEHAGDAGACQCPRDGLFPCLDRPPGLPEEVEGADEDVVAGRHARQRAGDVSGEPGGMLGGEPVEVRCGEFGAAVGPEQVSVQRVEQDEAGIGRSDGFGHRTLLGVADDVMAAAPGLSNRRPSMAGTCDEMAPCLIPGSSV